MLCKATVNALSRMAHKGGATLRSSGPHVHKGHATVSDFGRFLAARIAASHLAQDLDAVTGLEWRSVKQFTG